ncbi:MAG TPA: hypothetical protein VKA09_06795 [Nitrososphaeraceae archaeon]|nr:hypothetical protein [Nitrososphaeraceae archaeon]
MDFPYEDVSECEVEGVEDCRKNKIDSNYCEGLKERFRDDCEGFKSKEECDEYWNIPPICDENTPPGTTCRDEGDLSDCKKGFRDYGFGCEKVKKEPKVQCPDSLDYTVIDNKCVYIGEEPEECPEGQIGTPPDCETPPGILPPPENGEDPPEDEGDETENNDDNDPPEDEGDEGSAE